MTYYSNINKTILFLMFLISSVVFAQEKRNGITYQAVIVNNYEEGLPGVNNTTNSPFIDNEICIKATIKDENGTIEYEEVIKTWTDQYGMINIVIGTGDPITTTSWDQISWSAASKSLQVDVDLTAQCYSFQNLSLQEFTAVPFALYAPSSDIPGPKGDKGEDGLSAYDIYALNNTDPDLDEVAWLASLNGEDGLEGPQGLKGEDGLEGPQGLKGEDGLEGPQGIQGIQGLKGEDGLEGAQGIQGLKGEDGLEGAQGIRGLQGISITTTIEKYENGSNLYITDETGTKQIFIENGEDGSEGPQGIQGEKGEDGLEGPQGIQGLRGANGLQGAQGIQGEKGEPGEFPYDWPDGTALGDILTWIWDGNVWAGTILQSNDNLIVMTSLPGSNSQMVCEASAIEQISYAINVDPSGLTVTGLPKGITYNLANDILNITGTVDINVSAQTTFTYTISVPNGNTTITTKGTIIVNPLASIELQTGNLQQNSCLDSSIESLTFKIEGPAPNATVTGLPNGVTSNLSGDTLTISGTPTGTIVSGSIFNFVIETTSLSCQAASISGAITLTDCSSCFPSVNAGIDNTICSGDSYPIQNSSAANFTSLVWTTSGTGTFNDVSTANATYFPTNADFSSGSVNLILTGTNNSCTEVQEVIDTMTLSISDCTSGSIDVTLVNNLECHLFAYNAKYGATIQTNNIQEIATAGLCYNNTGGPTINDVTVSENNSGSGWWANATPMFELELLGLPLDQPLFIRPYVITIANDVIYGDQIEVQATDPNLNHIFNFTETGSFDINNFPVTTTSEITFVNVKSLSKFSWASAGPMSRNIVTVNFPVLTDISGSFNLENEFSIRKINAPVLGAIGSNFILKNTSTIEVLFPSLQSINLTLIDNNSNLKELYFPQLVNANSGLYITNNASITTIDWPQLKFVREEYGGNYYEFKIENNASLQTIRLNALEEVNTILRVRLNLELISLYTPQLFVTGNYHFSGTSIVIYSNPKLAAIDFSSLKKVYNGLSIRYNYALDVSQLPCAIYVYYNDGLDCSPENVVVSNNQNDTYCFQDISLRQASTVTTQPIVNITKESAESGGVITSNSFVKMKSKGVCWSVNPNPTVADVFSENGNYNDAYDSYLYNLLPNTTYYVRAYVEDCNGYYYGNELTFTTLP